MKGLREKLKRAIRLGCLLGCVGLMAGCSSFVGKADPNDPLPYDPANYDQKVENGAAVFTLSSQGKQAMADKDAGVVKQKKKKWWHLW